MSWSSEEHCSSAGAGGRAAEGRPRGRPCCTASPNTTWAKRVENLVADRNDPAAMRRGHRESAASRWFSTTCTTGSAAPRRRRWRPPRGHAATTGALRFHVQRGGLRRRPESPRRRSARARQSSRALRPQQGHERAGSVPPASQDRLSGGHVPAAVRLRPGESVLPRGILLGPPARRAPHPDPGRWHAA